MLPGRSILPESTTQPVPYTPYGGDWTEEEQIEPGTVNKYINSPIFWDSLEKGAT